MNALIIAANNKEDLNWVNGIKDWSIFLNTEYQPAAREAYSYLSWICSGHLFDEQVFCQGDPFKHDPEFAKHLTDPSVRYYGEVVECNPNGAPHYEAPLHLFCMEFGLPTPDVFRFVAGAQYRVTRDQVLHYPMSTYQHMMAVAMKESKAPWIFERLWPLIWDISLPPHDK